MSDSYEDYGAENTDDKRSISYSVSLSSERNKYNFNDNNTQYIRKSKFDEVDHNDSYPNINEELQEVGRANQKLINLERDREYLIRKNRDLEDNISRLEKIIDTQFTITQPKTIYASYPNGNYSSKMSTISSYPSKGNLNSKNGKGSKSKSKGRSKQKTIATPKNNKVSLVKSKTKAIWNNEKEREEKQSMNLKTKINELRQRIEELKEELKLNMLETQGESYLLYEVDKWQKRTNIIGKDYIENLALIKKKLFNDKIDYQTEIKQIQNICAFQLSKLKENCEGVINKQNYTIENYIKNNNDLRKRLDKMKNVFAK